MNHYVVRITIHLKKFRCIIEVSRIEIDCWKSHILLGVVCLYVYNSAHIQFTVLGVDDSK
jgi:hypothetical protein